MRSGKPLRARRAYGPIAHSGSGFLPVFCRMSLESFCISMRIRIFSSMGKAASRWRRAALARKRVCESFRWAALTGFMAEFPQDPRPLFLETVCLEDCAEALQVERDLVEKKDEPYPIFRAVHFDHDSN